MKSSRKSYRQPYRTLAGCCLVMFFLSAFALAAGTPCGDANEQKRPCVALVLSGGGARGGAHIGVLEELEKNGIPLDLLVGTSYGALVGGLYAAGYSTQDIEVIISSIDWAEILDNAPDRKFVDFPDKSRVDRTLVNLPLEDFAFRLPPGLQRGQKIRQMLDRLTAAPVAAAGNRFDALTVSFRAVATDILSGEEFVFDSGSLALALRASISAPGFFSPVEYEDLLLVDGGIANNLPVDVAIANGADIVIAVDVSTPLKNGKHQVKTALDVLDQVIALHIEEKKRITRQMADFVIVPPLGPFDGAAFDRSSALIPLGRQAASDSMGAIRSRLQSRGVKLQSGGQRKSILDPAAFDWKTFTMEDGRIEISRRELNGLQEVSAGEVSARIATAEAGAATIRSIDRAVSGLHATELFQSVGFRLRRDSSSSQPGVRHPQVLSYHFQELPSTRIGFGFRYDLDHEFTGTVDLITHRFLDSEADLFIGLKAGAINDFDVGLKFGDRFIFSPQGGYLSVEKLIFQEGKRTGQFQKQEFQFRLPFQLLIGHSGLLELGYRVRRVDIDQGLEPFRRAEATVLAETAARFEFDSLDDRSFPGSGTRAAVVFQWNDDSLGSDVTFNRLTSRAEKFVSLDPKNVIGFRGSVSWTGGDIPFFEQLYTGGFANLSFSSQQFTGLNRDQILSRRAALAAFSYRHRIDPVRTGMFSDLYLGLDYNVGFFGFEPDSNDLGAPLHGYSAGVFLDTLFLGPLQFAVGGTNSGNFQIYFSVGHSF